MTTIINTPPTSSNESGGNTGMIIGLIVLVVFGYLFFVYGLPAVQQMRVGTPQINVPSEIDVNVKQSE